VSFDSTGKYSFDHVYTEPDPRPYCVALRRMDYHLPQVAKPHFAELVEEYRLARGVAEPTVLDIGCSYGVNAALYRRDITMDELYRHYDGPEVARLDRAELIERDRRLIQSRGVRFVGLDTSGPALDYARAAGFLDQTVHADLEQDAPTEDQSALLAQADLVVSTGCLGYVTERTVGCVAELAKGRRPWMAHFVLRMFSYEPIAASLARLSYTTTEVDGVFKQRRFADDQEQKQILDALSAAGVEPHELETEGWLCARLYHSRPDDTATDDTATVHPAETRGRP